MTFYLTEDEREIGNVIASMLMRHCTLEIVRESEKSGDPTQLWAKLVATGVPEMCGVPQSADAVSLVLLTELCQQAGRYLAPVPLVEFIVGSMTLVDAEAVAAYEDVVTHGGVVIAASSEGRGESTYVVEGLPPEALVVYRGQRLEFHRAPEDLRWERVDMGTTLRGRWPVTEPVAVLATGSEAKQLALRANRRARTLSAARLTGLAQGALDLAVTYGAERHAFGKPVSSFQANAHRLADLATQVKGADELVSAAACEVDGDGSRADELASMALLMAAETARNASYISLHLHGGYGYMLKYDVQMYFRRAMTWSTQLGPLSGEWQRLWRLVDARDRARRVQSPGSTPLYPTSERSAL